ncbi:MAG: hypothetical protein ACOYMS_03995 [Terrimicrobiaceae bacterium]
MSDQTKEKSYLKPLIILVVLGVTALVLVFVFLAWYGDDVPTKLPAATQTSPGN